MKTYDVGLDTKENGWINLHRNENLFIDDEVMQHIVEDALKLTAVNLYPDIYYPDLKKKLAALHNIEPANIFLGNGADEVLSTIFYSFRTQYDKVNLPRVSFKMYDSFASKFNYKIEYFNNYPIVEKAEATMPEGLYVIDSPNSISGEELAEDLLLNLMLNDNNFIVHDNIYGEFSNTPIPPIRDNFMFIRHFSKFYGLAALRIGYCIASETNITKLERYREPYSVNALAVNAALECLKRSPYFSSVSKQLRIQKTHFEAALKQLGFDISKKETEY